jgi:acetylornithine deacetylase/succinyl-diaminopimelate desuccinylase-like protein
MKSIELLEELVKIPSVSSDIPELLRIINYCKDYFKNYKNVFFKDFISNRKPSVLISNCDTLSLDLLTLGHLDVVPVQDNSMFVPVIKDGKMYGRGVVDMKSADVVSMKMLEYVLENNFKLKFGILLVTDEEVGGVDGAKKWSQELNLKSKILLDLDCCGNINKITKRGKGLFRFRLTAVGESAHGSMPWLGIDANQNLIQTIINLQKHIPYISKDTPIDDKWITTLHVGIINGGTAVNIICPNSVAEIDCRRTDEYSDEELKKIFESCLEKGVSYEMTDVSNVVLTDFTNKYVKKYIEVLEKETGNKTTYSDMHGGTDARFFAGNDISIIMHGLTGGEIHSPDEWLNINDFSLFEKTQIKFLEEIEKET